MTIWAEQTRNRTYYIYVIFTSKKNPNGLIQKVIGRKNLIKTFGEIVSKYGVNETNIKAKFTV